MSYPLPFDLPSKDEKQSVIAPTQPVMPVVQQVPGMGGPSLQDGTSLWDQRNGYPGDAANPFYSASSKQVIVERDPITKQPRFVDMNDAKALLFNAPPEILQVLSDAVKATGKKVTPSAIESFAGDVMDYQSAMYAINKDTRPWLAMVPEYVNALQQVGGVPSGRGGAGGPTKTVNLTDPGTAKQLINRSLQQYLGRNATRKELREFVKALNSSEMANPQERGVSGSTAVASGGFNPATFAEDYAAGMEGAGEFQAVTVGLDNFINALANPTKVI